MLQRRGQLPPAPADVLDRAAAKLDLRLVTDTPPRARLDSPSDIDRAVPDELTGRAAAARQAAGYQQVVEPQPATGGLIAHVSR